MRPRWSILNPLKQIPIKSKSNVEFWKDCAVWGGFKLSRGGKIEKVQWCSPIPLLVNSMYHNWNDRGDICRETVWASLLGGYSAGHVWQRMKVVKRPRRKWAGSKEVLGSSLMVIIPLLSSKGVSPHPYRSLQKSLLIWYQLINIRLTKVLFVCIIFSQENKR